MSWPETIIGPKISSNTWWKLTHQCEDKHLRKQNPSKYSYSVILPWSMYLPQLTTLTENSKHVPFPANFTHSLYTTLLISFICYIPPYSFNPFVIHLVRLIHLLYTSLFTSFIHYTHPCSFFPLVYTSLFVSFIRYTLPAHHICSYYPSIQSH